MSATDAADRDAGAPAVKSPRFPRAVTEIAAVAQVPADLEALLAHQIEVPTRGSASSPYAFELEGWALGRRGAVTAVEVVLDDTLVWSTPVNVSRPDVEAVHPQVPGSGLCGYYTPVNALRLPPDFEVSLAAALDDGSRVGLGRIQGRRPTLLSSYPAGMRPLMVTSLGRSGSTMMVRLLASHRRVVAYRPWDYEPRVATYWLKAFLALSEPVSYLGQLDPAGNVETDDWWRGLDRELLRRMPDRIGEQGVHDWMGGDGLCDLVALCQGRVERLYEKIASAEAEEPAYFCEKFLPDPVSSLMWEIYDEPREVIIVRDFRDMVSSVTAYNAKRGMKRLGQSLADDEKEWIWQIRNSVLRLLRAVERRSDRAHVIRYEDLILSPRETVEGMLAYLELDSSPAVVDAMLASLEESERDRHMTAARPEESIGRWRRDLSPELQEECVRALGFGLEAFGYRL